MAQIKRYRAVAEFEPQESVMLTWPLASHVAKGHNIEEVVLEVIRQLIDRVRVVVQCRGIEEGDLDKKLRAGGIDPSRVELAPYEPEGLFISEEDEACIDFSWVRDYGAEVVMDDEGNRAVVDFDDAYYTVGGSTRYERGATIASKLSLWQAARANINDVVFSRMISEGGDREFNGRGVMMAVKETEVDKRNPNYRMEEVEWEYKRLFGLEKIIWLPRATYTDEDYLSGPIEGPEGRLDAYRSSSANGHIDEMCRFVNPNTILLAEVSEGDLEKGNTNDRIEHDRLEEARKVLEQAADADGNPFNIVRIPVPEPLYVEVDLDEPSLMREVWLPFKECLDGSLLDGSPFPSGKVKMLPALSYCNFLITNGAVLAQKYYREGMPLSVKEKDDEALRVLEKVFPDREIIQIDTLALNLYGGGIHCLTRQIPQSVKK